MRSTIAAQRTGSWLFLAGSLAFTGDAALAVADGATLREALYLAGCLLFVIGCGFFVRASRRSDQRSGLDATL